MSQSFYNQYIQNYLPIIKIKYIRAYQANDEEEKEKLKKQVFNLKSLREWQKEEIWKKITS
jgi:hypothetical protein